MTAVGGAPRPVAPEPNATALPRPKKAPIAFAVVTLGAFALFALAARQGVSTFELATGTDFIALPPVVLPTAATGIAVTVLLAAITVASVLLSVRSRRTPLALVIAFAVLFVLGFLTWAAADATLPVPGLLIGALGISTPLVFGALGGVICERVGVVNIAIEGQLLAGAFASAVVATITGQPLAGLVAAAVAGVLVSLVLASFSIRYLVDQVIVGVVVNVLVAGFTSFLFATVLVPDRAGLNSPEGFSPLPVPVLSQIPLIGPVFFRQTFVVYLLYVVVVVVAFALYRTRWGLRLRAVGEHPQAADTVGIRVNRTRFANVALAGAITGVGGSYLTLAAVGAFSREMTAGVGYIALAAVIFGRWDPIRATLAALLFGFATNLQSVMSIIDAPLPSEFMLMLPYVVTIIAVAGLVGHVRGPAAAGTPYVKS